MVLEQVVVMVHLVLDLKILKDLIDPHFPTKGSPTSKFGWDVSSIIPSPKSRGTWRIIPLRIRG